MDGWMDGWVGGWVVIKSVLRISYSNQKGELTPPLSLYLREWGVSLAGVGLI